MSVTEPCRSWEGHERCTEVLVDRTTIACMYILHSEYEEAVCGDEMELLRVILNEGKTVAAKNFGTAGDLNLESNKPQEEEEREVGGEGVGDSYSPLCWEGGKILTNT